MILTDLHLAMLAQIEAARPTIHELSLALNRRASTVSMVRNRLRDARLISDWNNYEDRMSLTPSGRRALKGADHDAR